MYIYLEKEVYWSKGKPISNIKVDATTGLL